MTNSNKKVAIFGASGLGREVADICYEVGYREIVFIVNDPNEKSHWENKIIIDTADNVRTLEEEGFQFCIGIGDPKIRKKVVSKYPDLSYPNIIHPSVIFGTGQRAELDSSKGVIIAAGSVITNSVNFGDFIFINIHSRIGHDSQIESFVSLMANVTVSGNVHIGEGAYLGSSSVIVQGKLGRKITIGKGALVGIGSVVLRSVKSDISVFGNPARKI